MKPKHPATPFAVLLQDFFCQRLVNQQNVSHQTVHAYRDAFRILLRYLEEHRKRTPATLTFADLDAPIVLGFLDYLERKRKNSIRTRNARFAAIRSFLSYAAAHEPASLPLIQRVLAIPMKRFTRPQLEYLARDEIDAVLNAPDRSTWSGLRDQTMFTLLYNMGIRVSEVIGLRLADVGIASATTVRIMGKGRKERTIPLWKSTTNLLKAWKRQISVDPEAPLFPNARGGKLSRSGVEHRLRIAVHAAVKRCATLRKKHVSPHTLRHTTAMHMLESGAEITVIALWLGHESTNTTHHYVTASLGSCPF